MERPGIQWCGRYWIQGRAPYYGDGEPKLQIGPRSYRKTDGTKATTKAGRLAVDDVLWLSEVLEEVKEKMNEYYLKEN